ncbi:MAG: hypothetical protein WDO68_19230 [Gammaproteobacteria bacterium]
MVSLKSTLALFAVLAFAGVVAPVVAQEQSVTVTASRTGCEGMSPSESSQLAREAEKNGEYQRASECFVVAGEYTRAHRASTRAAGEAAALAKHNASTAAANAKSQMARVRAAFR